MEHQLYNYSYLRPRSSSIRAAYKYKAVWNEVEMTRARH